MLHWLTTQINKLTKISTSDGNDTNVNFGSQDSKQENSKLIQSLGNVGEFIAILTLCVVVLFVVSSFINARCIYKTGSDSPNYGAMIVFCQNCGDFWTGM